METQVIAFNHLNKHLNFPSNYKIAKIELTRLKCKKEIVNERYTKAKSSLFLLT